jgi:hypothetical protein
MPWALTELGPFRLATASGVLGLVCAHPEALLERRGDVLSRCACGAKVWIIDPQEVRTISTPSVVAAPSVAWRLELVGSVKRIAPPITLDRATIVHDVARSVWALLQDLTHAVDFVNQGGRREAVRDRVAEQCRRLRLLGVRVRVVKDEHEKQVAA